MCEWWPPCPAPLELGPPLVQALPLVSCDRRLPLGGDQVGTGRGSAQREASVCSDVPGPSDVPSGPPSALGPVLSVTRLRFRARGAGLAGGGLGRDSRALCIVRPGVRDGSNKPGAGAGWGARTRDPDLERIRYRPPLQGKEVSEAGAERVGSGCGW